MLYIRHQHTLLFHPLKTESMGKKRRSSWFTIVKRAFTSPTKSCKKKEENGDQDHDKKREKRRWVFRKGDAHQPEYDHRRAEEDALAVAAATAAAAEAAAATAQAAAEITRLSRRSGFIRECYNAALVIQTAFRGYLARRALKALKGIVKLQAFIRGQNVRKQAKATLRCMQALDQLQAQMCEHQTRPYHDRFRKSMFAESNNLWDVCKHDIRQRKSTSAERRSIAEEWSGFPCTMIEEDEALLQTRYEAALKREKALAYALSQQLWRLERSETPWLNRWMATKTDRRETIKTVHVDTEVTPQPSGANTPCSASKYSCNRILSGYSTPRYMATTESAKAKARSASTPKQRPATPGGERVRKRLCYPVSDPRGSGYTDNSGYSQSLRSPSFRSVCPAIERLPCHNSCCCESFCGEISPASTTMIRRWLH